MKKILQLLHDNRSASLTKEVQNRVVQGENSDEATIYLYDMIVSDDMTAQFWGGVSAQQLVPEIAALKASVINLRINSPGGDVFAAQAISATLKQHSARIVAHIDGYAASAATAIACACDEVIIADGAMYMIHNAWTFAMGNRHDLLGTAEIFGKVDGQLADKYAKFTNGDRAQIVAWMDAETWFTSAEAITHGFANKLSDTKAVASAWNLAAYANAPKAFCAPPAPKAPAPEASQQYAAPDHRARQTQRLKTSSQLAGHG